ncbi:hypothetical protein AOLI_G00202370 [Acnodon oligacanthus]
MPDIIQAGLEVVSENQDCVNHGVTVTNDSMRVLLSSLTTVFLPLVYIVVFVVGLPTNAMALWVFLFRTKKKHPASILMANLALADLLFIVWLPLKITYHFNGNDWTFGEPLCKVLVGFFYGNMYCSTIFIACISVQRYCGIVHPLSRKLSSRVTVCVCVCVWVVVWLLTAPLYLYDQTIKVSNLNITTCHDVTRFNQTHFPVGYFLTMGTVGYGVPCVVCIVSYLLTFRSLSRSVIDASSNKKKRKAIVLMVTVLVMFLVCFTPSNIMLMVHYSLLAAGLQNDVYGIYMVALCLGSLNSCLDPFVYYYISEEFRGSFGKTNSDSPPSTLCHANMESHTLPVDGTGSSEAPAVFTGGAFLPKEEDEQGVNVSDTAVRILNILMANLALADLLFIVWLPLKITYHFNGNDWTFGEPLFWLLTVPLYLYDQTVKVFYLEITSCHDVTRFNQTHFPVGYFLTMGTVGYGVPCVVCIVSYLLTFRSLSRSVIDASSNKKKRKAIVLMVTVLVITAHIKKLHDSTKLLN